MAPFKNKPRAVVPQSDYETDNPVEETLPTMQRSNRTTESLNYSVIRRYVKDLSSILSIASFCVVYNFDPEAQSWEKLGIDGSLFVNSLTPSSDGVARFNIVVLNRRSTDPASFTLEIKTADDVELTDEYIILQNQNEDGTVQIYGLWVFTEPHPSSTAMAREINGQMIKQCAMMADTSRKIALQNAQESEDELQSVPMGRQLSLRELFGKQREADADFSIHHHHNSNSIPEGPAATSLPVIPNISQANFSAQAQSKAPTNTSTPRFTNTPDTDFFLSAPKAAQDQPQPQPPEDAGQQGQAVRKAKHHPPRRQQQNQNMPIPSQYEADYENMSRKEFWNLYKQTQTEGWSVLLTPFGSFDIHADSGEFNRAFMLVSDKFSFWQQSTRAQKAAQQESKVVFESTWIPTVCGVKVKSKAVTTML